MLFQEAVDFAHHLVGRPPRHAEGHMAAIQLDCLVALAFQAIGARAAATIPSLRDQIASVGTGGLSVMRGIGGSSTLCPATHS